VTDYQARHPSRVRVFLNDRKKVVYVNGKPTGLWNFVNNIRHCRGEYIALLEGDDYWTSPLKLQKQVEFLEKNPDCAVCFHNVRVLDEANPATEALHHTQPMKAKYDVEDLLGGNFMHTCSVMFRARLFADFPRWYFKCPMGDWPLHILNAQHGRIGYLDEVMAVYRRHVNGVWSAQTQVQILANSIQAARQIRTSLTPPQKTRLDDCMVRWYRDAVALSRVAGNARAAGRFAAAYLRTFPFREDTERSLLLKLALHLRR
jgi:Glycosyl transferase family 2